MKKINKKIFIILGTKAQLIKMAPIMKNFDQKKIPYQFIFTGQHQQTIEKLSDNFQLKPPDFTLYKGKDITGIFQMILWGIKILWTVQKNKENIFKNKNGLILVHGDTFSTLLGAIIGKFNHQKIAHVESGLRSFIFFHPFPEEIIRLLVFQLSDIYFCPGLWALNNLKKYKGLKINTFYNTHFDSVSLASKHKKHSISIPSQPFALCSLHRFENIFSKKSLKKIIKQIEHISSQIPILFILHIPTQKQLKKYKLLNQLKQNKNITLLSRQSFFNFIQLLKESQFLISDGGSNQEESFYLGKPCLLMRKATERKEGIGKNVFLSKLTQEKIDYFISNIKKFQYNPITTNITPSNIIATWIKKNI